MKLSLELFCQKLSVNKLSQPLRSNLIICIHTGPQAHGRNVLNSGDCEIVIHLNRWLQMLKLHIKWVWCVVYLIRCWVNRKSCPFDKPYAISITTKQAIEIHEHVSHHKLLLCKAAIWVMIEKRASNEMHILKSKRKYTFWQVLQIISYHRKIQMHLSDQFWLFDFIGVFNWKSTSHGIFIKGESSQKVVERTLSRTISNAKTF